MIDLLGRIYRIARANGAFYARTLKDKALGASDNDDQDFRFHDHRFDRKSASESSETRKEKPFHSGIPRQVIEDLDIFNLKPPSSLEEVRRARNREIKKYHSDKFMNDPEKLQTSKQIMQIYNAAYTRLEAYYNRKG